MISRRVSLFDQAAREIQLIAAAKTKGNYKVESPRRVRGPAPRIHGGDQDLIASRKPRADRSNRHLDRHSRQTRRLAHVA
jgi:hypothetical protein